MRNSGRGGPFARMSNARATARFHTMRLHLQAFLVSVFSLVATGLGQNYYIPDNAANAGTCNAIPLGGTSTSFTNQKFQMVIPRTDLGNLPALVTGLGFAACGNGDHTYGQLVVRLDHYPANLGGVLSTTFANNISAAAVTVLSATDYTWRTQADTWNEIGLQNYFVFNGVDDLLLEIEATGSQWQAIPSTATSAAFRRDVRPRLYSSFTGTAPATGTLSNAAIKVEVSSLMARLSTYGRSCLAGMYHSFAGSAQLGQSLAFELRGAPANTLTVLLTGLNNPLVFPMELSMFGMPGCYQYFGAAASVAVVADGTGFSTLAATVPQSTSLLGAQFLSQYAALSATANPTGAVTSNFGRVVVGN